MGDCWTGVRSRVCCIDCVKIYVYWEYDGGILGGRSHIILENLRRS